MYKGDSIDADPIPMPPTMRAMLNSVKSRAKAEPIDETANNTAERSKDRLRPVRSLRTPAKLAPTIHPINALDAAQPSRLAFRPKRVVRNPIAPDITAVS
jgi:hypothetical protein